MSTSRLEITLEPEATTYRDEGGRFNYLFFFVILRTGPHGIAQEVRDAADNKGLVPLSCRLEYEDGLEVPERSSKPSFRLLGPAGVDKPKEEGVHLDCATLRGSIRYKIMKLSRNHDGKKFRLKIWLRGVPEEVVPAVYTRGTLVLSKRKWLKADKRAPEICQRKKTEEVGGSQNVLFAAEAGREKAQNNIQASIREITGLKPIEHMYPRHVSVESYHSSVNVSKSPHLSESDEEDEFTPMARKERTPRRAAIEADKRRASIIVDTASLSSYESTSSIGTAPLEVATPRISSNAKAAPAHSFSCPSPQQEDDLKRMKEQIMILRKQVESLRKENSGLKRKLVMREDEDHDGDEVQDDKKRAKLSFLPSITSVYSKPLELPRMQSFGTIHSSALDLPPRMHSLGIVLGDDDDQPNFEINNIADMFSAVSNM